MSTTLATRPAYEGKLIAADKLKQLEELAASQANMLAHPNKGSIFSPAFQTAEAIGLMREMITPEVMKPIMALQGIRLGFRTDKDKESDRDGNKGYPVAVVRDCLIEAVLVGARPSGNEFNIIAGNMYLTREFFTRQLREWPGLTDLVFEYSPPVNGPYGAMVECKATWSIDGKRDEMWCRKTEISDNRICVRVNAGMGADAIFGKADRKLKAKIWQKLTGSETTVDGDVDDDVGNAKAITSKTLEIPPETGSGKPNGTAPTTPQAPREEQKDPHDPKVLEDLMNRIEQAQDHRDLRRIKASSMKARQAGTIWPDEDDQITVMLQEAKRRLPETAGS